ncbi:MAG TPA: serine hydrolase domain-containing protein [Acidimicrobiales bacterium]|nr:serine hydrolase domain-containing protein [Acidimicrobiales bacterium]
MSDVEGRCDARLEPVRDLLAETLSTGEELGAGIVVDVGGDVVMDVWGGWADEARTVPWGEDTIVNVWSTTKTVTSLAALVLVDRGVLDPYAPVARYWPEFAANGKEGVQVRHLMSHTSGVSGWEQPVTVEDLYDWDASTARLAAQAPWWGPGSASGYHAIDQGHLVGEVVRRVDGRSLKRFVAEELAGPLRADFQIGAVESDWPRVAPVVPPPPTAIDLATIDPDSVAVKTFTGPMVDAAVANTPGWRRADIGAANGHGNARSVARLLRTVTLGGTNDGVRLLSPETVSLIFDEQSNGVDLAIGVPVRFGIGFALPEPASEPWLPTGRACHWGGWGGSVISMDLERGITVSYMMNKMGAGILGSDRTGAYVRAVYQALGA